MILRTPEYQVFDLNPETPSVQKFLNLLHEKITFSLNNFKTLFEPVLAIQNHFDRLEALSSQKIPKMSNNKKIFLFVTNIDSVALDSIEFKTALALLAATESFKIAASTAHPFNFLCYL